jgi:hypothetical protein
MSIRITRLAALVAAMLFATGASSQATYNLTTTVSNFTFNGASVTLTTLSSGTMITVGGNTTTLANGGYSYTDPASGETIYLGNDAQLNLNTGFVTVQEQIFANVPGTASGYFNFTTNILVNGNPGFTETLGTNLLSGQPGYALSGLTVLGSTASVAPSSVTIPGYLIQNVQALANSGSTNTVANNPAVSATFLASVPPVPEPASVVMLGLGLISVSGVALRRRMAK